MSMSISLSLSVKLSQSLVNVYASSPVFIGNSIYGNYKIDLSYMVVQGTLLC